METVLQAVLELLPAELSSVESAASHGEGLDEAVERFGAAATGLPELQRCVADLTARGVSGVAADAMEAAAAKERGRRAFAERRFEAAARHFTEALVWIDERAGAGETVTASQLFCNRALCLLKLEPIRAAEALEDCNAAVELDNQSAKPLYRRACAREALGDGEGALADAQAGLLVSGSSSKEIEQLVLRLQRTACRPQSTPANCLETPPAASCIPADAEEHASSSNVWPHGMVAQVGRGVIKAEHCSETGWGLTAAEPLHPGKIIWREEPAELVLLRRHRGKVCSYCLGPLPPLAPLPCPRCRLAKYCSHRCRCAGDAIHASSGECGLAWAAILPEEAVLAVKAAARIKAAQMGAGGAASSALASQEAHVYASPRLRGGSRNAAATLITACVAAGCYNEWLSREATNLPRRPASRSEAAPPPLLSAMDVLHGMCKVDVNGIAIAPAERASSDSRVALALFAVSALMNHSCSPNISVSFEGRALVTRSLAHLPQGAPLLHCYGPQVGEMCRRDRQEQLRSQYNFECGCAACGTGVPSSIANRADVKLVGFACPQAGCSGAIAAPTLVAAGVCALLPQQGTEEPPACSDCGVEAGADDMQSAVSRALVASELVQEAGGLMAEAVAEGGELRAGKPSVLNSATRHYLQALDIRRDVLHPDNQLLGMTHDALADAFGMLGGEGLARAVPHCEAALRCVVASYPAGSSAEGFLRSKLAELLAKSRDEGAAAHSSATTAEQQALAAVSILSAHFGEKYEKVVRLRQMLAECDLNSVD